MVVRWIVFLSSKKRLHDRIPDPSVTLLVGLSFLGVDGWELAYLASSEKPMKWAVTHRFQVGYEILRPSDCIVSETVQSEARHKASQVSLLLRFEHRASITHFDKPWILTDVETEIGWDNMFDALCLFLIPSLFCSSLVSMTFGLYTNLWKIYGICVFTHILEFFGLYTDSSNRCHDKTKRYYSSE